MLFGGIAGMVNSGPTCTNMMSFVVLLIMSSSVVAATLPHLNLDPIASISGISSGADFALQFFIAYSNQLSGVGVFAGQLFSCAVYHFGINDPLTVCANQSTTAQGPGCVS